MKLIVLDRLLALRDVPSQEKILQELAMDVLRILATPDLEVRRKTLRYLFERHVFNNSYLNCCQLYFYPLLLWEYI